MPLNCVASAPACRSTASGDLCTAAWKSYLGNHLCISLLQSKVLWARIEANNSDEVR